MFSTPVITTRLNALLAALVLAAICALVAGGSGYALGHRLAKADGDAALAKLQRAHAEATAKAADEARLRLIAEVERNNRLAQALADEKATHAQEKQSLLRRIANVTTVYVPAPGLAPRPLPRAVFTAGFMREYNTAIGLPTADAGTAAAGTGGTSEAGEAPYTWLRDSGLSQADILAHVADYGERCRNLEAQVNRLLDRSQEATDGLR
jgi:hypothetical protein